MGIQLITLGLALFYSSLFVTCDKMIYLKAGIAGPAIIIGISLLFGG